MVNISLCGSGSRSSLLSKIAWWGKPPLRSDHIPPLHATRAFSNPPNAYKYGSLKPEVAIRRGELNIADDLEELVGRTAMRRLRLVMIAHYQVFAQMTTYMRQSCCSLQVLRTYIHG
jgi:hypothetical protein